MDRREVLLSGSRLREIKDRFLSSTKGDWTCHDGWKSCVVVPKERDESGSSIRVLCHFEDREDMEFTAEAHQDIPWLLELVEQLKKDVQSERDDVPDCC